jgi:LuxR family maltose regulon positive regulatory protein
VLIARAQFSTAKRWLRAVPAAKLRENPDLLIWSAWVDLYTNDFAAAEANVPALSRVASSRAHVLRAFLALHRGRFEEAVAATESAWQLLTPGDRRMQATISNLRALWQQMRGLFAYASQEAERVMAIAGQSPAIWISFVHAAHISSMTEMSLGNLGGAWRQLEIPARRVMEAERRGEPAGNRSQLLAIVSAPKAMVQYLRNQIDDAEDTLERYEPFLYTILSPSGQSEWHQLRARLSALTGDEAHFQEALRAGIDYAARHGIDWMEQMLQWERVEYDLNRGDLQRARSLAEGLRTHVRLDSAPEYIPAAMELYGPLMSALRFLVRSGSSRRALEYLPIHIAHSQRQLRRLRLTKLRLLEALARREIGDHARAIEAMRQAVDLGSPTGAIRIFLDEGSECRSLLQELERSGRWPDPQGFLDSLRTAFEETEGGEQIISKAAPEQSLTLSTRELQIIQRLAEGHSNLAVGQQLFLSPNTVKWHLSQIYAKLGVKNRTQAVHVARQQNLTNLS